MIQITDIRREGDAALSSIGIACPAWGEMQGCALDGLWARVRFDGERWHAGAARGGLVVASEATTAKDAIDGAMALLDAMEVV